MQITPVGIIIDSEANLNFNWREGTIVRCLDTGREFQLLSSVFYRTFPLVGTKSGQIITNSSGIYEVVFGTAWEDIGYSIEVSCGDPGSGPGVIAYWYDKVSTGFKIVTRQAVSGLPQSNIGVSWLCTRHFNE